MCCSHGDMTPDEILDRWFTSEAWSTITTDADQGCPDSLQLMEQVNEQLNSVIFHLKNDSGADRLVYELRYFEDLCDDFDVA